MIARLEAVEARLAAHAAAPAPATLTGANPDTGERWTAGQVWGHIAEIVPFWTNQARRMLAAPPGEMAPVGRGGDDTGRLSGIERGRRVPIPDLFAETQVAIAEARRFIDGLSAADLAREGRHPRYGPMPVGALLERLVVAHLEEHAAQLDGLRRQG